VRFLHTSDWHLGRLFHGVSLVEDQAHVLHQLVSVARDAKVDALLIAGDLYDRAVPPTEAVVLLDDILSRLVLDLEIAVLAIAGNHDSPERLGFAGRVLASRRLHVAGALSRVPPSVTLRDRSGPVEVHLVPYAEPSVAREVLAAPGLADHDAALRAILGGIETGPRSVVVAHAFVVGGEASESERPLSVGGAGTVDASALAPFAYAALGHLHRPQGVGRETLRYSGSLLKYSFQEATHRKSVSVVDMDRTGACRIEEVPLVPRHDVRRLSGTLPELLTRGATDPGREDYVEVSIRGRDALLDPLADLRRVYPNVLSVLRPDLQDTGDLGGGGPDPARQTDLDLFSSFFEQVTGGPLTPAQRTALESVLESLRRLEREVVA
jgi:exonuclease SbcD